MTDARRHQIIRLLETRFDHLPQPSRRDDRRSGFVHDTLAPTVCPTCEGVDDRCADCRGRGSIEVRRRRDPYAVEKILRYGFTVDRHETTRARDAEIARLEQQTAPPKSEADLLAETREHRWLEQGEPYRALERALDAVRRADETIWRALVGLHVWSPMFAVGIRALDVLLPARLSVPAVASAAPAEARDDRIVRLVMVEGRSSARVAAAEGLSVSQVNRIVKRASERSAAA